MVRGRTRGSATADKDWGERERTEREKEEIALSRHWTALIVYGTTRGKIVISRGPRLHRRLGNGYACPAATGDDN